MTYVICASVAEDIVEGLRLGHVFSVLADDNCELNFVVGEMFLNRLSYARDPDWSECGYECCMRFIE